jgi:hypothetical protein|tara:strand:+ start:4236 stop:4466 length:231 start_codon:yes stop_codon:yes gene_type:complete
MIPIIGVKLPIGNAVLLTSTIGGATTNTKNNKQTDVYTDTFPEGLTIDMTLEDFYDLWLASLVTEVHVTEKTYEMH